MISVFHVCVIPPGRDHRPTAACTLHVAPLEPPRFKMLFVLFYHVVALEAAAVAQTLHDLHKTDLTVKRNIYQYILPQTTSKGPIQRRLFICLSGSLTHCDSCQQIFAEQLLEQRDRCRTGCTVSPGLIFGQFSLLPGRVASTKVLFCCSFKALIKRITCTENRKKRFCGAKAN